MDRIDEIEKYWSDTIEEMQIKLEDTRVMATEHVGKKAQEMTDEITS